MFITGVKPAPTSEKQRFLKALMHRLYFVTSLKFWLAIVALIGLLACMTYQFFLGYSYESNETTNEYLRFARASSYAILVLLAVLTLPVMRNSITFIRSKSIAKYLPLNKNRRLHHYLAHLLILLVCIHASQYLFYYDSLEPDFADILLAKESDLVRSMQTTMYEFVSEDESIDLVANWITQGASHDRYLSEIKPLLKEDCTCCHSKGSSQTWAVPDLSLTQYNEVLRWTDSGLASKQLKINISGLLMFIIILLIWVMALDVIRKRVFHHFQKIHRLAYLIVMLLLLHLPLNSAWLVPALVLLVLEIYQSRYRNVYRNCPAQITPLDKDVVRLTINRPERFIIKVGYYVLIRIPGINKHEWHPFSLTGPRPSELQLVLKIRLLGDWTKQLAEQAEQLNSVDVRGPFASPATMTQHSQHCWLMAAGIGITPFLGILRQHALHTKQNKQIQVLWVLKERQLLDWLKPLIVSMAQQHRLKCNIQLYLTCDIGSIQLPDWCHHLPDNVSIKLTTGRPNWSEISAQMGDYDIKPDCYSCGPKSFSKQVARLCRRHKLGFIEEQF
ncbi:FAD-binding domain/Ferric reductase NAD binding domain/Ferric reductase like transmembrane component [Shewanella psychrophila]|uniref:FAD-binding domain/Ferric reductase NAD binding domain/Ferric reductase like transmembrane component n=1 Tax=Shewanella psychrophila TaxID=225848 RepID=A0A1S6HSZ1_9GAMM|nr:NADPH oxidase family protein [Shewanella psychrophila]AQS38635.1 FAD-binding domain/Ferric reductase NAD binding domain/Ferric reductase like transmembrane component [Shewanella psychrophila]